MILPHPQSFTKMHGLGNDFVVMSGLQSPLRFKPDIIKKLADRHIGIGFDQLLIIEPSNEADFFCRIFNADGSEAEQCGNGLRCIARFVHEYGLTAASDFNLATKAGIFPVNIQDYDHISISFNAKVAIETVAITLPLETQALSLYTLSLGNPHAIVKVDQLDTASILNRGPLLSNHAHFPHGINVGFLQIIDKNHAQLKTYERGAGLTHACGSNACAAAIVGITHGWLDKKVVIQYHYGNLTICWPDSNQPLTMTGPATHVFSGSVVMDAY